jgi:predicted anti-sigma-YlaC factor YlaD
MVCEKANELMMVYMDGLLDDFEEMNLLKHMEICETCREDFALYKEMLGDFTADRLEIIEAPEGFVASVMQEVERVNIYFPEGERNKGKVLDYVFFAAWGITAVAFIIATVLFTHGDVMIALAQSYNMQGLASFLTSAVSTINVFGELFAYYGNTAVKLASDALAQYGIAVAIAFVALAVMAIFQVKIVRLRNNR